MPNLFRILIAKALIISSPHFRMDSNSSSVTMVKTPTPPKTIYGDRFWGGNNSSSNNFNSGSSSSEQTDRTSCVAPLSTSSIPARA